MKSTNGKGEPVSGKITERLNELLKLMEEENLHELEVVEGKFQVKLVRQGKAPVVTSSAPAKSHASSKSASKGSPKAAQDDHGSYTPVKSPLGGIFYRAPSPEAAVFVKEGDKVTSERTLCIIEAMKVLNEINSGVSGTIVRILIENGKPVTAGQTLFLIDPAG